MEKFSFNPESVADAWEKSQTNKVIENLKLGRPIAEILPSLPDFHKVFSKPLSILDCSDGRVVSGPKLGLAGVGILLSPEDRQRLAEGLKANGIVAVSGHENCGAAGLAHPGDPNSDSHGYHNAKEMAKEVGAEYLEVGVSQMRSPFHDERALVVDESGRFDCANWGEFPAQFISSVPFFKLSDDYLKKEIAALTNIALGHHGFGERFDAKNPFYVLVSAMTPEKLERIKALAKEAVASFGPRVQVDGFLAPEQKA